MAASASGGIGWDGGLPVVLSVIESDVVEKDVNVVDIVVEVAREGRDMEVARIFASSIASRFEDWWEKLLGPWCLERASSIDIKFVRGRMGEEVGSRSGLGEVEEEAWLTLASINRLTSRASSGESVPFCDRSDDSFIDASDCLSAADCRSSLVILLMAVFIVRPSVPLSSSVPSRVSISMLDAETILLYDPICFFKVL